MHRLVSVPELYSKPLDLARPTFLPDSEPVFSVPLLTVTSEYNPTF